MLGLASVRGFGPSWREVQRREKGLGRLDGSTVSDSSGGHREGHWHIGSTHETWWEGVPRHTACCQGLLSFLSSEYMSNEPFPGFNDIWADLGDAISRQYASSKAMKGARPGVCVSVSVPRGCDKDWAAHCQRIRERRTCVHDPVWTERWVV